MSGVWLGLVVGGLLLIILGLKRWRPTGPDYSADWRQIAGLARNPATAGLAVIEADKLLDQVLRDGRWRGTTMSDRLKSAAKHLRDYNGLRRVHRLRNRLVHETGARVSCREADAALQVYHRGLKNLGVRKI